MVTKLAQNQPTFLSPKTKRERTWVKTQTDFVLQATELSMNSILKIIHQNLKAFQLVKVSRFGGHCVSYDLY